MGTRISPKRNPYLLVAVLAAGMVWALPARAQAPAQSQPPAKVEEPEETFRVSVEVVNVFFNVKDKRGALIPGLTKGDFEIYEDGKPQTIKYFSAESNQPLTLGLLLDTSGSVQFVLEQEKQVGMSFLNDVLGPKDLAFLINFDVGVEMLQDFTNSRDRLRRAFERARINTGGGTGTIIPGGGGNPVPTAGPRGGTKLFDAVYLGAYEKLATEVGRKAMIIISDGQDNGSYYTLKNAIEAAQKADAICYVLMVVDRQYGYDTFFVGDRDM
ncbi:MAG: VWA domain-containing protein, partial [Terriglobales bacterium]